jgi:esterase/lipase superfamily enzyme
VFYGTNRERNSDSQEPNDFYASTVGKLELGVLDVSIPLTHTYGEVERPSLWKLEFSENVDKHVILQSIEPVDRDEFVNSLAGRVAQSEQQEAFVFVHGFNVAFDEAARRTAQMSYDLKFDGPPVMFSWPSDGALASYVADMDDADASEADFREFIEMVATESRAKRIHLVAHSMGSRLVTTALNRLAEESKYREIPKLNEVILAAPDVDANVFKNQIAPRILSTADRVTIYASSTDRALQASKAVHQGPRLGLGGDNLIAFPESDAIDVVDASGRDLGWFALGLGHSAYGNDLLQDIAAVLSGTPAEDRDLYRHIVHTAWRVPDSGTDGPSEPSEPSPPPTPKPWWMRLLWWL